MKTRLLSALTPKQAAQIHRACLKDAVRLLRRVHGVERGLYVAGSARQASAVARLLRLGPSWHLRTQQGADLGARLHNAFRELLKNGKTKVIGIGTDTPWMKPRVIERAFRLLNRADVVLGPTEDGGYFLVGTRRVIPEMFHGISWGSHRVFQQTLRALARRKIRVARLATGFDLDRPADLARIRRRLARITTEAPALAGAIAEICRQKKRTNPARKRGK